jgi:hypothetical protein
VSGHSSVNTISCGFGKTNTQYDVLQDRIRVFLISLISLNSETLIAGFARLADASRYPVAGAVATDWASFLSLS